VERLDAFALAIEFGLEPGAWMRRKPADQIVHVARRARPVDARLCGVDLPGVSHAAFCLRPAIELSALERRERMRHQSCATRCKRVAQLTSSLVCTDRRARFEADWPRIESFGDAHHSDASLGIACHYGAVDWRRAAPAGQERSVQIERTVPWGVEDGLRQNQPIGHDHGSVGIEGGEARLLLPTLQPRRRQHLEVRLLGGLLHR
jgi:hypothetical protein